MRNILLICGVALLSSSAAFATPFETCGDLYSARENLTSAKSALTCFEKVLGETRAKNPEAYTTATEFALQTAIWIYTESELEAREPYADLGLTLAAEAMKELPKNGLGPYWSGVFRVMKCRLVDTGAIPTCFLKYKKSVLGLLKSARELTPAVHGYGPSRILGVIYREMPKIAGGDKGLAREYITETVKQAPSFSTNLLESAKLEISVKERETAKKILGDFVARDCATLDASRVPECKTEQTEARSILAEMKR